MLLAPEAASRFINNYKTILLEVCRVRLHRCKSWSAIHVTPAWCATCASSTLIPSLATLTGP